MMLKRKNGLSPQPKFAVALDGAYKRHFDAGEQLSEPGFVRALISETTLTELNAAAAQVYDQSQNLVRFRGGYLHGRPYAAFTAKAPLGTGATDKSCRRELADALLVIYVTKPDATGNPQIVRRSACMLMFKREASNKPKTPSYNPACDILPAEDGDYKGDGDKEQFYLFNRWPEFTLEVGSRKNPEELGEFEISNGSFDAGKYALVWDGAPPAGWAEGAWLFADPVPGQPIVEDRTKTSSGSLASMLELFIDGSKDIGRDFLPKAPAPSPASPANGWDELMGFLLGHKNITVDPDTFNPGHLVTQKNAWGASRDINPLVMHFLSSAPRNPEFITILEGNLYQHMMERPLVNQDRFWEMSALYKILHQSGGNIHNPTQVEMEDDGLPVLFVTVHHHTTTD